MNIKPHLAAVLKKDANNFDLLRLIAALGVIIGHSYALVPDQPSQDKILTLLKFDYSGSLAVKFFFFLSGLLVTNSILSNTNPFTFIGKRAFRIFPGLLICLLVSILIVGPLFTTLPIKEYLKHPETWSYLFKNLSLYDLQWRLPGVFQDAKHGLNGSLWTLPYEALCYLYTAILFGLGISKNKNLSTIFFLLVIFASFFAPKFLPQFFFQNSDSHLLPACFSIGAIFAIHKNNIIVDVKNLLLLIVLAILLKSSQIYQLLFYIALFYACIFTASLKPIIKHLRLPFDASYGVYIYGFIVQQCVVFIAPALGIHAHQLIACSISLALGILSWFIIEKRFIRIGQNYFNNQFLYAARVKQLTNMDLIFLNKRIFINKWILFVLLTGVAIFTHAIVLKFIFPGYYTPIYPQHSDFYIPTSFANSDISYSQLLLWPRPATMIFAKMIGNFGIEGSIAALAILVCLNSSITLLTLLKILNKKSTVTTTLFFALYCLIVFSHPYFYTFYAQDIGAQLSFFFLILGSYAFIATFNKSPLYSVLLIFICSLLAFLSKETYAPSAIILSLFWLIYYRKNSVKMAITPFIALCISLGMAIIINVARKSVFIDTEAESSSPYHIDLSPFVVLKEWSIYAREALNITNILLILFFVWISVIQYKKNKEKAIPLLVIGLIASALVSWIPNSLLPNHHFKGYSFNGTHLLYLPILILPILWQKAGIKKNALLLAVILCLMSPLFNLSKYKDDYNQWVLSQEKIQKNLIYSLSQNFNKIPHYSNPIKILIKGITFPFHPFAYPQSLRIFTQSEKIEIDVLNHPDNSNKTARIDLVKFVNSADTSLVDYDFKWTFNEEGSITEVENLLGKKIFEKHDSSKATQHIGVENFASYNTSGFYTPEDQIIWTNGQASIQLSKSIQTKDSIIIELNTYLPPISAHIIPEITIQGPDNKKIAPSFTFRKENTFYYLFNTKKNYVLDNIYINSQKVDASPDKRTLSFPFMSMDIKFNH